MADPRGVFTLEVAEIGSGAVSAAGYGEKGVNEVNSVNAGATHVIGSVLAERGDAYCGSIRADFAGTSGGASDTTLCSLRRFSVLFGKSSLLEGQAPWSEMIKGASGLLGL